MKKDTLIGWGVIGAIAAIGTVAYLIAKDDKTKTAIKNTVDKVKGFIK